MTNLISIIVPIYNTEAFLAETIESVLAQTFEEWELLLIDDGSTDSSSFICEEYAAQDRRISYHYKTNGGQASARNLGIKKSKGNWIAFLDADDLWLPEKLEHQLTEIETFKADFLYGLGYYYYPEKENKLETYDWITGVRRGEAFFQTLFTSCAVNTNTVLVKKTRLDEVGYFNEDPIMRGTEDWDLWMRIAKKVDKIYGSPNRDVYYRIHAGGIHFQHVRMLKGKAAIYAQYDADASISRLNRLRQYRYVYRELMNHLWEEKRIKELKEAFNSFTKKDRFGLATFKQRILFYFFPMSAFIYLSQKIIYRIAYRLEWITYKLFLK